MPQSLLLIGLVALAIALPLLIWLLRSRRRERSLVRLLDLADAMQALLDRSQQRMQAMQSVVGRVPADIAAQARESLESTEHVLKAKRDILQHRLWIQRHGHTASQRELDAACDALQRGQARLASQLDALEHAGAELAQVTEASAEAARREPPALRRGAPGP